MEFGNKLVEYLRQGADTLTNMPTEAQRFITNPRAFTQLITGNNPLPKETGFVAGATGLSAKNPAQGGILNPASAPYQEGYEQGEPVAIASMALPAYASALRAGAPKAYNALENYMVKSGGMSNIVPIEEAKKLKMPVMTDSMNPEYRAAIENTPSAKITEDGLVINLMRKQKPEQAAEESVRSGVFYLPEGSPTIKHYGGSTGYGGTEKIVGETLYKNPLIIKGATGGKAPENAYARLTSPEEAKQLSVDALQALVGSNKPAETIKNIETFLEKYVPQYKGNADYIYENSKGGNKLRYALQELAIADRVRRDGYDSVIGLTKTKGKPTLSEVFDVRETHYPTTQGDFTLHPDFEALKTKSRREMLEEQILNKK